MQLCNITMFLLPSFIVMSTLPGNDQIILSRSSLLSLATWSPGHCRAWSSLFPSIPSSCCPASGGHFLPCSVSHPCLSSNSEKRPLSLGDSVSASLYHSSFPFSPTRIPHSYSHLLSAPLSSTSNQAENLWHVDILKYPSSFFVCLYPKSLNLLIPLSHSQIVQLWFGSWTFPQNSQSILASTHPLCTPVHPLCLHWSVLFANFNSNNNSVSSMGFFPPNCCRSYSSPLKICNVNCKINKVNKTNMFSLPAGCEKNSHASLWNRKQIIRLLGASPELHVSFSNQLYGINSLYIII